jgi:anti-sigma regulatory factor (Ser/Thr protein kinase)
MADVEAQTRDFHATREQVSAADTWVEQVGLEWGLAERTVFGARICVAEIAANVIEHGGTFAEPAQLSITLRRRGRDLEIEITDSSRPFDPTTVTDRPLSSSIDTAQIGGLGLRLVRSYASDIAYRRDGSGNHVTLRVPEGV